MKRQHSLIPGQLSRLPRSGYVTGKCESVCGVCVCECVVQCVYMCERAHVLKSVVHVTSCVHVYTPV